MLLSWKTLYHKARTRLQRSDREAVPKNPIETYSSFIRTDNSSNEKGVGSEVRGDDSPSLPQEPSSLEHARRKYGPDLQFQGAKQNGYGPEMWGITIEQLLAVRELEGYDELHRVRMSSSELFNEFYSFPMSSNE